MSGTAGKMTEFTVKLADTPVCIRALHPQMKGFLREYLSEEKPELVIETKQEDIERERREDLCTREREGLPRQNAGDAYLETLAIYRQLAEKLAERNVLLFHGSALAMDGEAYLFAARSGTGKSTHARLWREAFGERVVMINDDKPLLQVGEEGVRVFGTPWNGKHRLGNNASAPPEGPVLSGEGQRQPHREDRPGGGFSPDAPAVLSARKPCRRTVRAGHAGEIGKKR